MPAQSTVTVTTTPTPLFTLPEGVLGFDASIAVDGELSPGGVIYIGASDVASSGAKKGRRLADGEVFDIGLSPNQDRRGRSEGWCAVTASGSVQVSVLLIPGA